MASDQSEANPIRFITETAADSDFFEGSHQRVADAIALTVQQSGAKTIGLVGRWGSGKSTVIKLVSDVLAKAQGLTYHVFTYDAWLHQSDPPRRAFLEQLISFLSGQGLGSKDTWDRELKEVQQQKDETTSTTTPVLTAAGKALLLPLFLLPIAFTFVSRPWYEAWAQPSSSGWNYWPFSLGLLLLATPIVVLSWLYLCLRPRWSPLAREFWTKRNWIAHKPPYENESLLALVANKHVTEQHTASIKGTEPTAIEFQKMFRRILQSIKADKERLVIVVDNLDRLDREEAIAMWSTIRSFFLGAIPEDEQLARTDLPTIVLPIDESAMKRTRKEEAKDGPDRSFMDKSFDVVFHVSPPILSNWQSYLNRQLGECFADQLKENWRYQVIRIYRHRADSGKAVTPRDINKAVNSIAALWLQNRTLKIPFVSVAYYAIHKEAIDDDLAKALTQPLLDISDDDPDWQRSLAALHYGIAPENALQVLLDQPLRKAIDENNPTPFIGWTGVSGFAQAIQKLIDEPGFLTAERQANMINILSKLPPTKDLWIEVAWRQLAKLFPATDLWVNVGKRAAQCVEILLSHVSAADRAKFLIAMVTRIGNFNDTHFDDADFLKTAPKILKALADSAETNKVSLPALKLPITDEQYLELAAALDGNAPALTLIEGARDTKGLASVLADQLMRSSEHQRLESKARIVLETSPDDWETLVTAASTTLQSASSASSLVLGGLFKYSQAADDAVVANAEAGHLQSLINTNWTGGLDIAVRAITLTLLARKPLAPPPGGDWESAVAAVPELPALVEAQLQQWRESEFWPLLSEQLERDPSVGPLMTPIMSSFVKRCDLGDLPLAEIIPNPDEFLGGLADEDKRSFVEQMSSQDKFWETLAGAGLSAGPVFIAIQLISSETLTAADRATARKGLAAKLKAVTSDEWVIAVRDGGVTFEAAHSLQGLSSRSIALEQPLFAGLSQLMPELIASPERPYATRWFQAVGFLAAAYKRTLLRNLRDQLLGISTPANLHELLAAGGDELLTGGDFDAKADEIARKLMVPLASDGGLSWMTRQPDLIERWLKRAKPESREYVRSSISDMVDQLDEEDQVRAKMLLDTVLR
jgi:hypothetical protein